MSTDEAVRGDGGGVPRRSWWGRVWKRVLIVLLVLAVCCGGGCLALRKAVDSLDPNPKHMTKEQAEAFEERYWNKSTLEQEGQKLEALLARTGDEIAALVPGLTWSWKDDMSRTGCPGDPAADTWVGRFWARKVVFDGPIPPGVWPQAVEVVRRAAASYGATEYQNFIDKPDNHDSNFYSPEGARIGLTSAVAAVLVGVTPCRLPERYFTERHLPVPGAK
ncbi:LppA family lipoprotein [Segniliparus rotundus]|nr:LppA family lipoprotein [Segniliparus rotundus]